MAGVLAAVAAPSAGALTLVAAPAQVRVVLEPGRAQIDPAFGDAQPLPVALAVEAGDGGALALSSVVDNLTGALWTRFDVTLEGVRLASRGSVRAIFGGVAGIEESEAAVRIHLDPAEPFGLDLGEVGGVGVDWVLDLGGLAAGDTFALTFAPVPEPSLPLLLVPGLVGAGARGVRSSRLSRRASRAQRPAGAFSPPAPGAAPPSGPARRAGGSPRCTGAG